jgi:hypothetical protein
MPAWVKRTEGTFCFTQPYPRLYIILRPRRPRLILPGVPLHIIQRGNNRQPCFHADGDYRFYLSRMAAGIQSYERLRHTCLCADDQPCPLAPYPSRGHRRRHAHETIGATICPICQPGVSPKWHTLGGQISFLPAPGRPLSPGLPTIYRAQPGSCRYGPLSRGIPVVKFSRQWMGRARPTAEPALGL